MSDDLERALAALAQEATDPSVSRDVGVLLEHGVTSTAELATVALDRTARPELRELAVWALGRLKRRDSAALTTALRDPDERIRVAAAQALSIAGTAGDTDDLVATMTHDESVDARQASAYALGLIGDPRAVQPLIDVLTDAAEAASVRGMAAEALADLGAPEAASHLIDALASPAAEVRFWAAFALRRLGGAGAVAPLQRLAESDRAEIPGHGTVGEEAAAAVRSIREREARRQDD